MTNILHRLQNLLTANLPPEQRAITEDAFREIVRLRNLDNRLDELEQMMRRIEQMLALTPKGGMRHDPF